ncbi:MAG: heavy metal-binding domain-containing protein [Chloroflexi bacterium]|nr:MAG: heavy metal-binding domain-containing protein [Chloroflexota bacterium]TMD77927.1 MAG: heavy metal-binding domain-containing protein [Chloroflexota bacterium]
MPFWKRSSPEDEQRRSQALQDAEASRRSLEAGGLPLQAQRRLSEEVQAGHPLFTSDLSVKEFSLVRNQGYTALSQVMGSSIYQVGWQFTRTFSWNTTAYELTNVSNAHQHAAQLALGRLEQEAALLRAHGVIGVRLNTRDYEWGQNLLEYTAIGTAIRLENTPLPSRPFLSDLSGQEFWTLLQAGYYPDGVVTGFCSYYVSLGSQATRQLNSWFGGGWTNQEIVPFSQGLYTARSLAMDRLLNMARRLNAIGVVGMHIHSNRRLIEQESNETKYMDFSVQFSAVGTAINALRKDHVIPAPQPTLTFTDLRPGRRGETSELTIKG